MKAKISRGGGFRGALNYLLDVGQKATGDKHAEIVGGNMAGRSGWELSREFGNTRALRPDVKKPVWHASLSLPKGEVLPAEQWAKIASDFVAEMGFSRKTPFVVIRHADTNYDHVHVLLSRIDLDAGLWLGQWEARSAINVSQSLEKQHGLQITPGLGAGRADRKRLSAAEINKTVRTGEPAPRTVIQNAIDELLDAGEPISATEFAQSLELAGIGVRANLATTGRMNGFSFEYSGVPFKSSQLGKNYSWKRLQDRGVSYEQIRDRAGLERFRAERTAAATEGAPTADGAEPYRDRGATPGDSPTGQPGAGPAGGAVTDGNRASGTDSADDARRAGHGNDDPGERELREIDESIADDDQPDQRSAGEQHNEPASSGRGGHHAGGAGAGGAPEVVENATVGGFQRDPQRSAGGRGDWASRFKIASSAKRRGNADENPARTVNTGRVRVDPSDLRAAREIDPTHYLKSVGYRVTWQGKHGSVRDERGDEHYRLTQQRDGRVLWCDLHGETGGDSIALVREIEPELPFTDAVYRLHGGGSAGRVSIPSQVPRPQRFPSPKWGDADAEATGRRYLRDERWIDDHSIDHAERSRMLRYDRQGSALFVGYDDAGTPRNVTRRSTDSRETVQKRDLAGSDKSFPPILPGDAGASVWVVEGGIDAIALHAEARAMGRKIPNIIVSGGSGVRSFLENRQVQQMLRDAPRVVISCDNEKDGDTQQRSDAQHERQREIVSSFNPEVSLWHPPANVGDLGDLRCQNVESRAQAQHDAARAELIAEGRAMREAAKQEAASGKNSLETSEVVKSKERDPGPAGPGL